MGWLDFAERCNSDVTECGQVWTAYDDSESSSSDSVHSETSRHHAHRDSQSPFHITHSTVNVHGLPPSPGPKTYALRHAPRASIDTYGAGITYMCRGQLSDPRNSKMMKKEAKQEKRMDKEEKEGLKKEEKRRGNDGRINRRGRSGGRWRRGRNGRRKR